LDDWRPVPAFPRWRCSNTGAN